MGSYWDFLSDNRSTLVFDSYQHMSYVVQSLVVGLIIGLVVAALCYRSVRWTGGANAGSAMAMTLPGFALFGLLSGIIAPGVKAAVIGLVFYGMMPILRNAVVGLRGVDPALVESAKGMGMSRTATLLRLEIPMAWPVIMTGVRVSAQMMMGVAAIAAYVSGPGLGGQIFQGLSQLGGANATERVVVATVLIIVLAIILDLVLGFIARLTTSRGIRV
ncbi:ABC transporter permease [Solicola gregarius]|uniref:ABC transporter permease n=1 Tax=Solicola gregarius TaxID=2908642 RepID=A0AA46TGI1_9ACTN|nr:ABC transporter permease [Solicola gregarius]UYM04840.1 ABC transporter permease [Solicola gregarius]